MRKIPLEITIVEVSWDNLIEALTYEPTVIEKLKNWIKRIVK